VSNYRFNSPDKDARDKLTQRLAAKGADVATEDGKRMVQKAKLLREDKDDPDKVTSVVPEGEAVEEDVFSLESDVVP